MDDSLEIGAPYGNEGSPHLQFCPYSCLGTSNIWEGRIVIFPISPKLMGIFIFVLFFYFMKKNVKEDHKTPKQ